MATLVLGAVGGLIGGPIGAALGAAIGNRVDQSLLAPKGRRGPRLNALSVQSSTYGSAIPKIFGAMRVSGTVIWSTDLIETRKKQGSGKGRPKTTVYSYAASFAVALSARPIVRVGRIWADGKLLRGDAGDFKTETGFRLHYGSGDQPVDPLIAAAEGAGSAPAYRGIAYAVFEDFQLGDYGNRIPSLSFEVIGDEGAVGIGMIAADLAPYLATDVAASIGGYAAEGDSVRGAIEGLSSVFALSLRDDGVTMMLSDVAGPAVSVVEAELGSISGVARADPIAVAQRSAAQQPEALALAYYDASRDYLPATQTARRDGGARRTDRIDLPATLDAAAARRYCEAQLSRAWGQRLTARIALPPRRLALQPGRLITLPRQAGQWRIRGTAFSAGAIEIDLVRHIAGSLLYHADPGRHVSEADIAHGPTRLAVIDLPPLSDGIATMPQIAVAAAGVSPGWRRASLSVSRDNGQSWIDAGSTAAPAVMGATLTMLPGGPATIFDDTSSVDVTMVNPGMDLNDADDAALIRGENVAIVGDEVIQFGRAVPLGAGVWRLSRLLRGRRGTDHASGGHGTGEFFGLLDPDSLVAIAAEIGDNISIMASGIGDADPIIASILVEGRAVRPLSPCHVRATWEGAGDTQVRWIRRSRAGWSWPDGVDVPLGEEIELYEVTAVPSVGTVRIAQTGGAVFAYTALDRAVDIAAGATSIVFSIVQIGQFARSRPAAVQLPL